MKQEQKDKAIRELLAVFDYFNRRFLGNQLYSENLTIEIKSKGSRKDLGWFVVTDEKPIIYIAEQVFETDTYTLVEWFLHQLTHYSNLVFGEKDVSADGYHNLRFKERAEQLGLNVVASKYNGYSVTTLKEELRKDIDSLQINQNIFSKSSNPTEVKPVVTPQVQIEQGYDSVTIRKDFKNVVKNFSQLTGVSMIDLVEKALTEYMKNYKP